MSSAPPSSDATADASTPAGGDSTNTAQSGDKATATSDASPVAGGDKNRRKSGVAKASALLATAKQSLHLNHSPASSTGSGSGSNGSGSGSTGSTAGSEIHHSSAFEKLGKTDPVLSVPQGSHNNSAGESLPSRRSTFRVGVTEDKNKKCRRTMEDTHAYLYNFLSTPAPILGSQPATSRTSTSGVALTESSSGEANAGAETTKPAEAPADSQEPKANTSTPPTTSAEVLETDNGYFAIFDGHAGTFAADWCGKKLHVLLEDIIRANPNAAIPELLDQTFTSVDQQLQKLPLKNSGCTAICAVLRWEDRIPNPQSATGSTAIAPVAAAVAARQQQQLQQQQQQQQQQPSPPPASSQPAAASSTEAPSSEAGNAPQSSAVPIASPPASHPSVSLPPVAAAAAANSSSNSALPQLRDAATRQRVLYTANVGDARIVLCRNGKALRLSYDHKGSDENEGRRITNAGGLILNNRVNGVLAVTRALGDAYMKDLVTGHPYTTETVIQPDVDEFLILACDGLWDVCTDQDAVDLVRNTTDPQLASKQLVDHALSRFSTDNLSCMVVRFDNQALRDAAARTREPIGVDGDAASQRGGMSEAEALVDSARKSMHLPPATPGASSANASTTGSAVGSSTDGTAETGAIASTDVTMTDDTLSASSGLGTPHAVRDEIIHEEEEKELGPEVDPVSGGSASVSDGLAITTPTDSGAEAKAATDSAALTS